MQPVILFLAVFLVTYVDAIIPLPCANNVSLTTRTCCPTPNATLFPGAGQCGINLGRGSCVSITNLTQFKSSETDVRKNWPFQYFSRTCNCSERFGGFDCGECSFGYNDGTTNCAKKTVYSRISVGSMSRKNWRCYHKALRTIKGGPSRYKVSTMNFTADPEQLLASLVRPNTYDLFVWVHHFVAKDNEVTLKRDTFTDYAHEGPGFPTWHRLFLLWLEREIQIATNNHKFRLPFWDWSDPSQREILFQRDRLGENVNRYVNGEYNVKVVTGDLFFDWPTVCWENTTGKDFPIDICDPTISSNETLRRCPDKTECLKDNTNWPSKTDINTALSMDSYDASPYNRFVQNQDRSFRNFMEGFVVKSNDCEKNDTLCSPGDLGYPAITRKLHNTVHIILGLGSIKYAPTSFEKQGVMSCVAASPNDPIFINHHANIDCILEQWLQRNKDSLSYPTSPDNNTNLTYPPSTIREGHGGDDYIVPFIPVYMHKDMFKTADNFGYKCSAFSTQAFTAVVVGLASAAVAIAVLDL